MLKLSKDDVKMLVASIISQELSDQNRDYFPLFFKYEDRGDLTKAPFGCDSLLLVSIATAVGDYFGVVNSGLEENFIRYRDFTSWVDIVYDSLEHYDKGITFSTSGTTGKPKKVFHSMQALEKEAAYLAAMFKENKSIVSFVRPHHIYGFLYTIALPKYMQAGVSFCEPIPNGAIYQTPSDALLVATPAIYEIEIKKSNSFNPYITAVSSTQPLDNRAKQSLKEKGIAKVIEIYGSSQSLGIGYRYDGARYFTLFEYHSKDELEGIQDALEWKNEREFVLKGRLDGQIKHRGSLMELLKYEQTLSNLEGVRECNVVFAKGKLVAYIKPTCKKQTLHSLAAMDVNRPDSIVWIE